MTQNQFKLICQSSSIEIFKRDWLLSFRATEILKSKSVRSTDDVIDVIRTCLQQSQKVTKTNDLSFSSKSASEIDYFSNTVVFELGRSVYGWGKRPTRVCQSLTLNF